MRVRARERVRMRNEIQLIGLKMKTDACRDYLLSICRLKHRAKRCDVGVLGANPSRHRAHLRRGHGRAAAQRRCAQVSQKVGVISTHKPYERRTLKKKCTCRNPLAWFASALTPADNSET